MKQFTPILLYLLLGASTGFAQEVFQLAPPLVQYNSVFFKEKTTVFMEFAQTGCQIHVTLNGKEPTANDPVYTRALEIKKHQTTVKAKVFGIGFLPSETVEVTFYQRGLDILAINTSRPDKRYPGDGPLTLFDGKGGIPRSDSKTWMGFQQDTVTVEITLKKPKKVQQVLLEVLHNAGSWIFLPQKVDIFCQEKGSSQLVQVGTATFPALPKDAPALCHALFIKPEKPVKTDRILVKVYPLTSIPAWHPGKGTRAWLFVDEIKLY